MNSSLRERFARLGPIQAIDRVSSGSSAVFILRLTDGGRPAVQAVTATLTLARRGIPLLRAKRAVEEMLERGRAIIALPIVENVAAVVRELSDAGIAAGVKPAAAVDVRGIRERLGLTQDQFALRFGLDVSALRNWEQGRSQPETAVVSYFRVIERNPAQVEEVLASI